MIKTLCAGRIWAPRDDISRAWRDDCPNMTIGWSREGQMPAGDTCSVSCSMARGGSSPMELSITATGGEELSLMELHRWLRTDAAVIRSNTLSLTSSGESGQMGALDIIDVALTNATGLFALATSYASWRQARPRAPEITFTRAGMSITVKDGSPATIQKIMELLKDDGIATGGDVE